MKASTDTRLMRGTGLVLKIFRAGLEVGIVLETGVESTVGFEINLVVGSRMLTGLGSGRSSRSSEEVLSLDGNSSWLAKTDWVVVTGEVSGWSQKVTLLSAQLINRLCRVSQSSLRTAENPVSSLVIKNLTWWVVPQGNWTEISVACILYDGEDPSMRQSLIQGTETIRNN
jgi:hypothetical protein